MNKEKLNNYIAFIKTHKYNFFFAGAIAILLFLIISMAVIISSNKGTTTNVSTPTQNNSQNHSSTQNDSTSSKPLPIITPNPVQATTIENETLPQISPAVAVPYGISDITLYGDSWATMKITNSDVGGGAVIAQKVNGAWKVVMGPGSFFPSDDLQSIGAPQELIDHITNQGGPSESPSPIPSSSPNSYDGSGS